MTPTNGDHTQVVRDFYQAVAAKDAAALEALIFARFADDVVIIWPDSLPYGGSVRGAATLSKVFGRMTAAPEPVGPAGLELVGIVDGGNQVAAQLEFDWYPPGSGESIRTGALELWTFTDGLVREIRAYYWDTAACHAAAEVAR